MSNLCDSEDELQNIDMAEDEQNKKNQELKIKRRDYTGYDDDEFAPGNEGMKRSLLSKYDEFLEGSKETVSRSFIFTLVELNEFPGIPVRKFINDQSIASRSK